MALSRRDVDGVLPTMRDAHRYLHQSRDASPSKSTSAVLAIAETGAAAAATGFLAGRLGSTAIAGGIPLGLLLAGAGYASTAIGWVPSAAQPHVQNLSNGALAGWLAMWGAGTGAQMRAAAGGMNAGAPIVAGEPRQVGPSQPYIVGYPQQTGPLSEDDLRNIASGDMGAVGPIPVGPTPSHSNGYDAMSGYPPPSMLPMPSMFSQVPPQAPSPLTEAELQAIAQNRSF